MVTGGGGDRTIEAGMPRGRPAAGGPPPAVTTLGMEAGATAAGPAIEWGTGASWVVVEWACWAAAAADNPAG